MTRFARAKGSKASNERVPEKATPWQDMKNDLKKSQKEALLEKQRHNINTIRQKNYDNFLKETESKIEKKWASFPKVQSKVIKKKSKKNKALLRLTEDNVTEEMMADMLQPDPEIDQKVKEMSKKIEKVLKKEIFTTKDDNEDAPEEASAKIAPKKVTIKKNKIKKCALKINPVLKEKISNGLKKKNENNLQTNKIPEQKLKKNQKNKQQNKKEMKNDSQNESTNDYSNKKNQQISVKKNLKNNQNNKVKNVNKNNQDSNKKVVKRKLPKERDDKEHERKKPFDPSTIIINGNKEKILLFNNFPVLENDYKRLVDLKKSLISKGIPKSEVNKTMILERRKAEKFLSRQKKKQCFQCRQLGHLLSECPEIGENKEQSLVETTATGICFKCGSTEHNWRECKVNHGFKFAKCFICREQGHVAKECPDNPRGLYPKGGACKLCGDVTHLKKDCPKFAEQQKSNALFLNTISNCNIESLDGESNVDDKNEKSTKKIVKF